MVNKLPLLAIICLMPFLTVKAQSDTLNRREQRPFGISVNILGPTLVTSLNLDYFFSKNFSLEAGAGAIGYYAGVKVYFGKKTRTCMPYIGATYSNVIFTGDDGGIYPFLYLPVGYHFVGKKGFNFSAEIAAMQPDILFYGQLRVGYRFLKKKG